MSGGHSGGSGKIRTILIWAGIIMVVLLVLLWFITGGVRTVINTAETIGNPLSYVFGLFSGTSEPFRLPWQPDNLTRGPIPYGGETSSEDGTSAEEELADVEREYEATQKQLQEARNFGEPSPHRGRVRIVDSGASNDLAEEYIAIEASSGNTSPIVVSGWSLQSAVTGVRAYIPRTADMFVMGAVNPQKDLSLAPGSVAILSSEYSPVGTSFRENLCIGYLSQLRSFAPSLSRECPSPSESLPPTADNIRSYGDACVDFVASLPSCIFPTSLPPEVSSNCRLFVQTDLSYNGCVDTHRYTSNFLKNSWRMYLGASDELWRNSHDVVRLLDADGRTVDLVSY